MKYSAIILTAFAAGAMARALPEGDYDPAGYEASQAPDYDDSKSYDPSKTDSYKPTDTPYGGKKDDKNSYGDNKKDDKNSYGDNKKDDKNSYGDNKKDDKNSYDDDKKYAPVKQDTYEERKDRDGDKYHSYSPQPPNYNKDKSCYKDVGYPTNIDADKPCHIKWSDKDSKKKRPVKIYVYKCDDYSKPYETVCDSCGDGEYHGWKPSKSCIPSDDKHHGSTYRFKFCDKDNEDDYTWSAEFPIWNNDYYTSNKEAEKDESKCPPPKPVVCDTTPAPPAKAPEAPYPAAPAPAAPAPAAPAAPSYPTEAAAAPAAPAAVASNETAPAEVPASISGSSVFRASISIIVGVAALVTFAL